MRKKLVGCVKGKSEAKIQTDMDDFFSDLPFYLMTLRAAL